MATIPRQLLFGTATLVSLTKELFDREEEKPTRVLSSVLKSQSTRNSARLDLAPHLIVG